MTRRSTRTASVVRFSYLLLALAVFTLAGLLALFCLKAGRESTIRVEPLKPAILEVEYETPDVTARLDPLSVLPCFLLRILSKFTQDIE